MGTPRRRSVVNWVANLPVFTPSQRAAILTQVGVTIGSHVEIEEGFRLAGDCRLRLGDGVYLNHGTYVDCRADVVVGEHSRISVNVVLMTSHHDAIPGPSGLVLTPTEPRPIMVGRRVWIGMGAMVMPGVTIGDDCIIGAGALVLDDCAANGVYVGVPARRVRDAMQAPVKGDLA